MRVIRFRTAERVYHGIQVDDETLVLMDAPVRIRRIARKDRRYVTEVIGVPVRRAVKELRAAAREFNDGRSIRRVFKTLRQH